MNFPLTSDDKAHRPHQHPEVSPLDEVDAHIRQRADALLRESNPQRLKLLRAEMAELKKRRDILIRFEAEERAAQEALLPVFADFRNGLLPREEEMALIALGEMEGISAEVLKRKFPVFVHLYRRTKERHIFSQSATRVRKQEDELSRVQTTMRHLEKQLRAEEKEKAQLITQLRKTEDQCRAYQDTVSNLQREVEQSGTLQAQLRRELAQSPGEREERLHTALRENQALASEVEDLVAENQRLRTEHHIAENDILALRQTLAEEKTSFLQAQEELSAKLQTKSQEVDAGNTAKKHLTAQVQDLQSRLRTLEQQLADQHKNAASRNEEFEKKLSAQDTRLTALQTERDEISAQLACARKELDNLQSPIRIHLPRLVTIRKRHMAQAKTEHSPVPVLAKDEIRYGYFLAMAWKAISGNYEPKGLAAFEEQYREMLAEPDWERRYATAEMGRAVQQANEFQRQRLFFQQEVPRTVAATFVELYALVLDFYSEGSEWQLQFEFGAFQQGTHPAKERIIDFFSHIQVNPFNLALREYARYRAAQPRIFQWFDEKSEKGVGWQ